jgi:hypothetical protein
LINGVEISASAAVQIELGIDIDPGLIQSRARTDKLSCVLAGFVEQNKIKKLSSFIVLLGILQGFIVLFIVPDRLLLLPIVP